MPIFEKKKDLKSVTKIIPYERKTNETQSKQKS